MSRSMEEIVKELGTIQRQEVIVKRSLVADDVKAKLLEQLAAKARGLHLESTAAAVSAAADRLRDVPVKTGK